MDELQSKQNRFQKFMESMKNHMFGTMLELLKEKKSGTSVSANIRFLACEFHDVDHKDFNWQDNFLLDMFNEIFRYCRLVPAIEEYKSKVFFWILYDVALATIIFTIILLIYVIYSVSMGKFYVIWPLNFLRKLLSLLYWILFNPFMEVFIGIFKCDYGKHKIVENMACYEGYHIFFVVLSLLFALLLFVVAFLTAFFYNESQPSSEDASARVDDNCELLLLIFRLAIIILTTLMSNEAVNWTLIIIYILASIALIYHYFLYIPYFDNFVSTFWGSLVCNYCWISLNALLMMVIDVYGHIIIICLGIPVISGVIYNLRSLRLRRLLVLSPDKVRTETDALLKIIVVQQIIKKTELAQADSIMLIGIVNLHKFECQDPECFCKKENELFDPASGSFSKCTTGSHKDIVFLKHFTKQLYENALNKFISSPLLHISLSCYLFNIMKNLHASFLQLNIAERKKPTLRQSFVIYRRKCLMENVIKEESKESKNEYKQLTNVTEFEELLTACQKNIEQVANSQVEFWSQVANQLPDLNILHDIGKKIYAATKKAEECWNKLCQINPDYPKALSMYGNYMLEIKHHNKIAYELLDRAKNNDNKNSLDDMVKSSDILFSDNTVIIHISGNKDDGGKILKTNQGLFKMFGYTKTEVMGHLINILMPTSYARRHNDFLERFFKTGHKTVFDTERVFYGLHRSGHCFCIILTVMQMPSLSEGLQYVGMIRKTQTDFDFIITDTRGIIDCFSSEITSCLGLSANLFKESNINIQILAPDLMKVFSSTEKRKSNLTKFQESGEQIITFIVPKEFSSHIQTDNKKNMKELGKSSKGKNNTLTTGTKKGRGPTYWIINNDLNHHAGMSNKQITSQQLLQTYEYRESEVCRKLKCEIIDLIYGENYRDMEPLKLKVLKIAGAKIKKLGKGSDSDMGDYHECGSHDSNSPIASSNIKDSRSNLQELIMQEDRLSLKVEEPVQNREETKTTERLAGNVVTTENHLETIEANPVLNKVSMPKPTMRSRRGITKKMSLDRQQEKKLRQLTSDAKSAKISRVFLEFYKTNAQADSSETQTKSLQKNREEEGTPRMDLESLKGPVAMESLAAAGNAHLQNDSLLESESNESPKEQLPMGYSFKSTRKQLEGFKFDKLRYDSGTDPKLLLKIKRPGSTNKGSLSNINDKRTSHQFKIEDVKVLSKDDNSPPELYLLDQESAAVKIDNSFAHKFPQRGSQSGNPRKISSFYEEVKINSLMKSDAEKYLGSKSPGRSLNTDMQSRSRKTLEEKDIRTSRVRIDRKKKNNSRVITHYVDPNSKEAKEYQEYILTEEEQKLRRSLLAYAKKKNKDKKPSAKEDGTKNEEEKDENAEEQEKGSESGEEVSLEKHVKEIGEDIEDNKDTQSSLTSGSVGSTMRSYYSLRAAIDEKYLPRSIRHMGYSAILVFLLLLTITIVFFVMQFILYSSIKKNIKNVRYSEDRISCLIDVALGVTNTMITSKGYVDYLHYDPTNEEEITRLANEFVELQAKLKENSELLKDIQTDLSLKSTSLSSESLSKINPTNIELEYMSASGSSVTYIYTIWQAIMEIVVSGYRISGMEIGLIDDKKDVTVFFIMANSLNNILVNLSIASDAIMDEIEKSRKFNVIVFVVLLAIASFALLVSTILLIPVLNGVQKNKQEVFELFMYIKKQRANMELNKCRHYLGSFQASQEAELTIGEGEDIQQDEDEEQNADATAEKLRRIEENRGFGSSKRKFKKLSLNLGLIIFEFIFLMLLMEGYFILNYFLSTSFLSRISTLTKELSLLISNLSTDSLLITCEKLAIFKDFEVKFKNKDAMLFVEEFYSELYEGEEKLFDIFSKNYDYHTSSYKSQFNNIMFSNVCQYLTELNDLEYDCETFNQGILQKGIYSSIIKYWDYLRQLNYDYLNSARTPMDRQRYLNLEGLLIADVMQEYYFTISLNRLVTNLSDDIDKNFRKEKIQNIIMFCIYLAYLLVVCLIFWKTFIFNMEKDLWKTKSVLCILTPEIIMSVDEIRMYILDNSSTILFASNQK